MFRVLNAMSAIVVVIASTLISSGHAYAHESRDLGPYQVEVGWLNEPAFVGQVNGLSLSVTDTRTKQPVEGLEKTLSADVAAGGLKSFPLQLAPRFETPGAYDGSFVPTATGAYIFHIVGKIETLAVDEKFASGPNTFDDIADIAALQYPNKVPMADDLRVKLDSIQSAIDQTRVIAIVALAVAIVGLAGAALARRRPS